MAKKVAAKASEAEVTIRRAPRISRFLILGGALGAIVTLILTLQFKADPAVGMPALLAYFELFGIPAGIVLGAIVALVLDRIATRRAKTATASSSAG
jgi:hypothetical protein